MLLIIYSSSISEWWEKSPIIGMILGAANVAWGVFVVHSVATTNWRKEWRDTGFTAKGTTYVGLFLIALIAVAVLTGPDHKAPMERDASGEVVTAGALSSDTAAVGDCFSGEPPAEDDGQVDLLSAVPCASAHTGEIYNMYATAVTSYDVAELKAEAQKACGDLDTAAVGVGETDRLVAITPSKDRVYSGRRSTLCAIVFSVPRTGGQMRGYLARQAHG